MQPPHPPTSKSDKIIKHHCQISLPIQNPQGNSYLLMQYIQSYIQQHLLIVSNCILFPYKINARIFCYLKYLGFLKEYFLFQYIVFYFFSKFASSCFIAAVKVCTISLSCTKYPEKLFSEYASTAPHSSDTQLKPGKCNYSIPSS